MKRISWAAFAVTSLTASLMAGCATQDTTYQRQAQQVKPLRMPEGVNLKEEQNYYPSAVNNATQAPGAAAVAPSQIPPGSDLARFGSHGSSPAASVTPSAESSPQPATSTGVQLTQNSEGDPVLVVSADEPTTWKKVSYALKASDYQIVDKDRSMSSFYVLDVKATGNQITEKTPIYRVFLQPDAAGMSTRVSLLSQKNFTLKPDVAKQILQNIARHIK